MNKILYITDNPVNLKTFQNYFSQNNILIELSHAQPPIAIDIFDSDDFKIIIIDSFVITNILNDLIILSEKNPDICYIIISEDNDENQLMSRIQGKTNISFVLRENIYSYISSILSNKISNPDNQLKAIKFDTRLLEKINNPILITDLDTKILFWNESAEKLFGWCTNEVIGKHLDLDFSLDFGPKHKNQNILTVIKSEGFIDCEVLLQTKFQTKVYLELKLNHITDETGKNVAVLISCFDITLQKENEKKLHLLSDIILNINDGIVLTDLENKIIFINECKAQMWGYRPVEIIGKNILTMANNNPALEKEMLRITDEVLMNGYWSGELEEIRKDGKHVRIRLLNKLLSSDEGVPYAILGISHDISELKSLENKLGESEEWYRTLLENINGILIFFDTDGNILFYNHTAEVLFGYAQEEIKGNNYFDLFIRKDEKKEKFNEKINFILKGNPLKGFETTVATRDGSTKHIIFNINPRYDKNGDITGLIANGIDVTDLKILEQQINETKAYLENIITNSGDGIATTDTNLQVVTWNKACEKIYGYKSGEIIGKDLSITIPEDKFTESLEYYKKALEGEKLYNLEVERIRKDGTEIFLLITLSPIFDHTGQIIGISNFIKDITEKKLLEKQAYLNELKYQHLFEESKDFVFETSAEGKFISINQAGIEMLGYNSKEEILDLDVGKDLFVFPEDREKFKQEIAGNGFVIDYELHLKTKHNDRITILETATVVYDDNANIIGYRGIGRNVTDKKRHQEQILSLLIASQAFSRSKTEEELFDSMAKAIRRLNHNLLILMKEGSAIRTKLTTFDPNILKAAEKINRINLSDLKIPIKGHPTFEDVVERKKTIFNDNSIGRMINLLKYQIPNNAIEVALKELGYKEFTIFLPLIVFNEVIGIAAINSDEFTEEDIPIFNLYSAQLNSALENANLYSRLIKANEDLKKSYEQLRESQNLLIHSEKLKAIGNLASGVAHDFNNLLTVIQGRTQLLQIKTTDTRAKADLEIILKAAQDGADTVKRLQDFSKQKVEDNASALDVTKIIEDTIQLTQTRWKDFAQQKGIKIEIQKELANLPIVLGSGQELREILTNLILNAVDALPNGGIITIKTKNLDRMFSIEIQDNGTGMDKETVSKIFTPFFTTKGEKGTGLGLAMVKILVSKRQGEVSVRSELGIGTVFTIIFPKICIENEVVNQPHDYTIQTPPLQDEHQLKILIIDDEEELRLLLGEILSESGHQITLAKDGKDGIEKFYKDNFDLVFTDLGMPEMNGWQVAKAVKTKNAKVPVILISGWGRDLKDQDISNTGVDFLCNKPFHIDEVFHMIKNAKKLITQWKS